MAVTRQQKEEILSQLIDSFKKAKSVVFTQYQGTSVKDIKTLRRNLRDKQVAFKIARKTLISLAAKEIGFSEIPSGFMEGPIGIAFGMGEETAPAQVIHAFAKDHEQVKIAGAIFEGKLLDAAGAKIIATLPSRELLLAKLLGSLKAPVSGFHAVLHGLLRNFVYVLGEIQRKTPVPAQAESAPAMETATASAA